MILEIYIHAEKKHTVTMFIFKSFRVKNTYVNIMKRGYFSKHLKLFQNTFTHMCEIKRQKKMFSKLLKFNTGKLNGVI